MSEVPPGKTSANEPPPEVFDAPLDPPSDPTPFVPPVIIGEGPPSRTLPSLEPPFFIPPVVIGGGPLDPPDGSGDGDGDAHGEANPIVPVPEASTLFLLGS